MNKKDELVVFIKDWVDVQYASGRQTVMSDEEIETLVGEFQRERA